MAVYHRFSALLAAKAAREQRPITIKGVVCREIGRSVSTATLFRWERKDHAAYYDRRVIQTLCAYFQCLPHHLLTLDHNQVSIAPDLPTQFPGDNPKAQVYVRFPDLLSKKAAQENRKRISFADVTRSTGISRAILYRYDNYIVDRYTVDALKRLCEYFGIGLDVLFAYDVPPPLFPLSSSE